jgi:hypothetical protein
MTLKNKKQLNFFFLLFFSISFLIFLFFLNFLTDLDNVTNEGFESTFVDEINPFCGGIGYDKTSSLEFTDIENIKIEIGNSQDFYSNIFNIVIQNDKVIDPKYKNKFSGNINFKLSETFTCSFDAEVRISGDWIDHIDSKKMISSLDVKLNEGNIGGITKFKLFLPETRNGKNEIFVATLMENLGFISPRTSFMDVELKDYKGNIIFQKYIFQEKLSKEMIEHNKFREGPLLEIEESIRWEQIIKNNFEQDNNRYFMFAKLLNKNWSRRNPVNEIISLDALEKLNKGVFRSEQPWTQLNYSYLGSNINMFYSFDAALVALDSNHAITNHQRKFFYNRIEDQFYPIYYDGNSNFLENNSLMNIRGDYENIEGLQKAANLLIKNISIDQYSLKNDLVRRGVVFSDERLETLVNTFRNNLFTISQSTQLDTQKGELFLSDSEKTKTLNLPEQKIKILFLDSQNRELQTCDINISNCEYNIYEGDEDIFSFGSYKEGKSNVLFGSSRDSFLDSNNVRKTSTTPITDNVFIKMSYDSQVKIDVEKKKIEFSNINKKILIYGKGTLEGWSINLINPLIEKDITSRVDENLLTGCLTVYNVELKKVKFNIRGSKCEDSLNLLNVSGNIEEIIISESSFDGIDLDFSNLEIEYLKISKSKNDCLDLSSGNYIIERLTIDNCLDKGISIGENSLVRINKLSVNSTNIGVAVKDSSNVEILDIEGDDNKYCLSSYRKKQEFGPGKIQIYKNNCISINPNYIQKGSLLGVPDGEN